MEKEIFKIGTVKTEGKKLDLVTDEKQPEPQVTELEAAFLKEHFKSKIVKERASF